MAYYAIYDTDRGEHHQGQIVGTYDAFCWATEDLVYIPERLIASSARAKLHSGANVDLSISTMPLPPNMDTFYEAGIQSLVFEAEITDPDGLLPSGTTLPPLSSVIGRTHGWAWSLARATKSLLLQKVVEGRTLRLSPEGVVMDATNASADWWPLRGLVYHVPAKAVWCWICEHRAEVAAKQ